MILAESRISNLRIRNDQKQGLMEGQTFKSKILNGFASFLICLNEFKSSQE
jgi:hypothetical protein